MRFIYLFLIVLSISLVSSLSVNIPIAAFDNTTGSVNDSVYWDGHAWSDTRWLEIDGGNANTNIDIGAYDFTAEDITVDGELNVDDGITSTNNIEIWGSYFLKWLDNTGTNTYAYIMASITEFKIASVGATDMNFYYGILGSNLGASMDGTTGDWNFTQDINVDGDSYLSNSYPRTSLTYNLGSGALRWLWLYVQNISAEYIETYNLDVLENLNVSGNISSENYYFGNGSLLSGMSGTFNSTAWGRAGTDVTLLNRLDSVGIGTTNPTRKFHVNDTEFVIGEFTTTENLGAIKLDDKNGGFSCWTVYGDVTALGDTCGIGSTNIVIEGDGDVDIGTPSPTQKLDVHGSINQTEGNFTGNQIYAGMFYHNHTGTDLTFAVAETWYPVFFTNATDLNGFSYVGGFNTTSYLTANVKGVYQASYMGIGSGQNNHIYLTTILINDVEKPECGNHHKMAAGGDVITQSGVCIITIEAGDTVKIATQDHKDTGVGVYYGGNLNLIRIGN